MSNKVPYTKPALSIKEQINLLRDKGIQVDNEPLAIHYLQFIGYYRLSGFFYHLKNPNNHNLNTTFEVILEHYIFDRKLRMILFDAIERIEIALRSAITTTMTQKMGAFWYQKKQLFVTEIGKKSLNGWEITQKYIREATLDHKNKDTFLKHYYDKYSQPDIPPSWIVMETLSMGAVSKIFSLLKVEHRKDISDLFKLKERYLISWIRSLTFIRNTCAHHGRLWNRIFTVNTVAKDKRFSFSDEPEFSHGKIYSHLNIIAVLLKSIAPDNHWEFHIKELLNGYMHNYSKDMGFPENWDGFKI